MVFIEVLFLWFTLGDVLGGDVKGKVNLDLGSVREVERPSVECFSDRGAWSPICSQ
jgi:hypothetical protein